MNIAELVGLITNVVTALTAVVALILVILQMRQLDQTLRSQVYQGLIDNSLKIDELLIENPEFRKYVYGNEIVDKNTPDIDKVMSVMEFVIDIIDNVTAQEAFIPKAEKPGWGEFVRDVTSSPAAQYFLEMHGKWFSGNVPKTIEKQERIGLRERIRAVLRNPFRARNDLSRKMVSSFISSKISVRRSRIHGLGMFAKAPIKKGEIVFIKGGHILTREKVFSSQVISSYLPIADDYFIGATSKSEEKKIKLFLNHSCNPNCGLRGEITFIAIRDIDEGEELTCDYAMIDNEDYEFTCNCGAKSCRKKVTGYDWKKDDIQKRLSPYFARYLLEKIADQGETPQG